MSKSNMNLKLVTGLLMVSGSTAAIASMNNLDVQSYLGERFAGSIVVTGPTAQEILNSPSSVSVSGAPISARVRQQGTAAVIQLSSSAPINDPVLRLKVQAGSESRHYSAIIDPKNSIHQTAQVNPAKAVPHPPTVANKPTTGKTKPQPTQNTIHNNRQSAKSASSNTATIAAAEHYKVQPQDTIFDIARRYQPDNMSTAQTVQALMLANPKAFRGNNPNLLYADATLKIPSASAMRQLLAGRSDKVSTNIGTDKSKTTATTIAPASSNAAAEVAAIEQQLKQLEQQKAQLQQQLAQAQAASAPAASTEATSASTPIATTTASAPQAASAAVIASSPAPAPVAQPAPAIPEPTPAAEPSLMDLIVDYLPYLAGGVLALLLLAWLLSRTRKQRATAADDTSIIDEDNDVVLDLDDQALATINPDQDQLVQSVADAAPTSTRPAQSPSTNHIAQLGMGSAALASDAVLATSKQTNFMPSDEELQAYAQPSTASTTTSDEFNLDDLDALLKQHEFQPSNIADATSEHKDEFDFNLDQLTASDGSCTTTIAAVAETEQPSSTTNIITDAADEHLPTFNWTHAINNTVASQDSVDTSAASAATLNQADLNQINFDDFQLDGVHDGSATTTASNNALATTIPVATEPTTHATTPMADDAHSLDFNQFADLMVADTAAVATSTEASGFVSKFSSIDTDTGYTLEFDDSFDLNFDDLVATNAEPASEIATAPLDMTTLSTIDHDAAVITAAPPPPSTDTDDGLATTNAVTLDFKPEHIVTAHLLTQLDEHEAATDVARVDDGINADLLADDDTTAVAAVASIEPTTTATAVDVIDDALDFEPSPVTTATSFSSTEVVVPALDDEPTASQADAPANQTTEPASAFNMPSMAQDDSQFLANLQHTQDTKLDLAQMYIELGEKNAAIDVLLDLMEYGTDDIAARAEQLYQSIS